MNAKMPIIFGILTFISRLYTPSDSLSGSQLLAIKRVLGLNALSQEKSFQRNIKGILCHTEL